MSAVPVHFAFIFPGNPETLTGGYTYGRRIIEASKALGASVDVIPLPDGYPTPDTSNLEKTDDILTAIPDDTLVVFDGLAFSALPGLVGKHASRLRFVALVHHPLADESGISSDQRRSLFDSEKASLKHAQRVIVSSPFTRNRLQDFDVEPARCDVVEPGIDDAPFNAVRDDANPVRLLYVASLTERKGHLDLFEVLHMLNSDDWRLDLVGPADLAPEYGETVLAAAKAFGSAVHYHGPLTESELSDLYKKADIYVSPAKYEGYGMALATAVVHGLPIIAVDGGAVSTTPAGMAAQLVFPDEPVGFSYALKSAITDPEERKRLAEQSRSFRSHLKGWEDQARKFLDTLRIAEGKPAIG